MPHLTLDYSADLTPHGDITGLCRKLAICLIFHAVRLAQASEQTARGVRIASWLEA